MEIAFGIKQDIELIVAGGSFWCEGHLGAVPIDDRSRNPKYCRNCYAVIKADEKQKTDDSWVADKGIFNHQGKSYVITKDLTTVEVATAKAESPLIEPEVVTKIETKGKIPIKEVEAQKRGIMLHPGRPRKEGKVTRMTKWRRNQQLAMGL